MLIAPYTLNLLPEAKAIGQGLLLWVPSCAGPRPFASVQHQGSGSLGRVSLRLKVNKYG